MRSHDLLKRVVFVAGVILSGFPSSSYAQYPGFDGPSVRAGAGSGAGIVAVTQNVDGGVVPIGATAQVVVLFRNEGGQPLETGQINLYPSSTVSANVSLNQCADTPLQSGAECAIAISVKGLQAGPWRVEMLMLHSGRSRLVTSTLSGNVEASGDSSDKLSSDIETIPAKVDFGGLATSQTLVESVILRNITSNPIDISEVVINASENSGYSVQSDCKTLAAGQACVASVKWAPTLKGPATGALVIKHNGSTAVANVPLSGEFSPDTIEEAEIFPKAVPGKGLLVSSQKDIDFGNSVSTASTITVSLVNTGDTSLKLKGIKIAGSDNGLSLSSDGCATGMTLEPIEACPLTVNWSPTRVGKLIDDVQVLHDGARGVLVLPVRGESLGVVSQDQKAIVLTSSASGEREPPTRVIGGDDMSGDTSSSSSSRSSSGSASYSGGGVTNASSALDGLKITSFSASRAIVNGPSGSKLVHNNEPIMLGGVQWDVQIQKNGIEFSSGADRVLLLFDRSLSSINRISSQSSSGSGSSSSATSSQTGE